MEQSNEKIPMIVVEDLRKVYLLGKEKVVALNHINVTINKGEIVCIFGKSGSGKSTLLNMLAGLEKPTKGKVMIGKTNISSLNENKLVLFRQRHIGFVFQSYNLMGIMTALENVAMPLMFKGIHRKRRDKIAKKMLEEVGLGDRLHHRPNQMSGGQQQRVGLARAFVGKPKIVFADEPTGNLDSKTTLEVMELIVKMAREHNQTIILVSHDLEIAMYADRIIYLLDGDIEKIEDRHTGEVQEFVVGRRDVEPENQVEQQESQKQDKQEEETVVAQVEEGDDSAMEATEHKEVLV